ncbi:MAG TPA: EAL domain-containing protein [Burkholderiales bacterium]|nr:EAL domain-containing protein [Burkholderiales bacterium]
MARDKLKILLVEDTPSDAELCMRELTRSGLDLVSRRVDTREMFEKALEQFIPDLILSDFSLSASFDGLRALEIARNWSVEVPFIFVSGTIGEERAVEAMKRGATDDVIKDRLNRLVPVVERALKESRERLARKKAEQELDETRSRLDSVVSSLADVVWSMSASPCRLVYINQAAATVYGHPASDFLEDSALWLEVVHSADRDEVERLRQKALAGRPFDSEYRIAGPDGEVRWIHDRGRPVRDAGGTVVRIDGLARDITLRRMQQERIARLSRIHTVLSSINSIIVRVRERDELFREACRIAVEHGGFKLAWIGLLDRQTLDMRPKVWIGDEQGFLNRIRLSAREDVPQGRGVSGIAIRTCKPAVVNDVANDNRLVFREETLLGGFRSFVVLPLMIDSAPIGALYLYTGETGSFDPSELKLLVELAGDISFALEHIEKRERLDYLAYYDVLTGLPNRQLFYERTNQVLESAQQSGGKAALLVFDLQRFSVINDTLGRQAGDALLKLVAQRLQQALGDHGGIARISADIFAVALPDVREEADAAHVIEEKIMGWLEQPLSLEGGEALRISLKCGVALFPADGGDTDRLFRNAEAALKKAKNSGEKYLFYAPRMNARVAERLSLENRLRIAVLEQQFVLHYQPKMNLVSRQVSGLEALLRWASPDLGLRPPAEFIPILEETGLILDVGRWALRKATADYLAWQAKGLHPPRIAVNVSALQLHHGRFVEDVRAAIDVDGAPCAHIDLEITETMLMEDVENSIRKLSAVRAMGVQLALDDFGTGYSSLSYIAKLPVSTLKIDRSFIATLTESPEHMAIVSAVLSLARALNLKVVAEGVETEEQANVLRLLNCHEIQGYLFSLPLPPEEVERLIA